MDVQELCGWAAAVDPELFRDAFTSFGAQFERINIIGSRPIEGARAMLWALARKVLNNEDTPNYPQQIGDCVSFGAKNAIEYVQFAPIINQERKTFKRVFPPYLYGAGRVFIGRGRLRSDGSLGIWQAKAVMEFGTIPSDTPNLPQYSESVAKDWGRGEGPPKEFVEVGKQYIVKSAALVKTWEDVVTSLANFYPVTVASNVGFTMKPGSDGFHSRSGSWAHQMCIIGVDNEHATPHACILNSWGDVHGAVEDFKTGQKWPKGTLRVRATDVEKMLAEGDSFAYSSFDGFPAQFLNRSFFEF